MYGDWVGKRPPEMQEDPRAYAGCMYCERPECLAIRDCAHRVNGVNCAGRCLAATPAPAAAALSMTNNPALLGMPQVQDEPIEHTVAWLYD